MQGAILSHVQGVTTRINARITNFSSPVFSHRLISRMSGISVKLPPPPFPLKLPPPRKRTIGISYERCRDRSGQRMNTAILMYTLSFLAEHRQNLQKLYPLLAAIFRLSVNGLQFRSFFLVAFICSSHTTQIQSKQSTCTRRRLTSTS